MNGVTRGAYTTTYEVWFKTHAEATQYAEDVCRNYRGYGTMLRIDEENSMYVVRGHRGNSCE